MSFEEPKPCLSCRHLRRLGGTAHVACANPPDAYVIIDPHRVSVEERSMVAQKTVDFFFEEKELSLAARIVWPGCGIFPVSYDAMTIIACKNAEEGKPDQRNINQFIYASEVFKKGMPPLLATVTVSLKEAKTR